MSRIREVVHPVYPSDFATWYPGPLLRRSRPTYMRGCVSEDVP